MVELSVGTGNHETSVTTGKRQRANREQRQLQTLQDIGIDGVADFSETHLHHLTTSLMFLLAHKQCTDKGR